MKGILRSCDLRSAGISASLGALVLSCFLLAGCGDQIADPGRIPIPGPPLPELTLKILADAYEHRDIDRYGSCLAQDFSHVYRVNDSVLTDSAIIFDLAEELECANKVFECSCVSRIEMGLAISAGPWATEHGLGFRLEPLIEIAVGGAETLGITPVSWAELKALFKEDGVDCGPGVYLVYSSFFDIEMIPDPADEDWWLISEIVEIPKR